MSLTDQQVPGLTRFRNEVDGRVVQSAKAIPVAFGDIRYFYCSVRNVKIFRTDGVPLHFFNHMFETKLIGDQRFLDEEIVNGHPNIREASEEEIHSYRMATRPKEVLTEELRNDPVIKSSIENELIAKLKAEGKLPADFTFEGTSSTSSDVTGANNVKTDAQKIAETRANLLNKGTLDIGGAKLTPVSTADLGGAGVASNQK